jgi:hypothetical protein
MDPQLLEERCNLVGDRPDGRAASRRNLGVRSSLEQIQSDGTLCLAQAGRQSGRRQREAEHRQVFARDRDARDAEAERRRNVRDERTGRARAFQRPPHHRAMNETEPTVKPRQGTLGA